MRRILIAAVPLLATTLAAHYAFAGQAPAAASDPDIPISHQDRVYSAEQYSNTVSVTDPVDNKLIGTIRLGDPLPANLSPLYKGQLLVHGMGFSPDHRTIAVVAIGSNAVNFIDTATNSVKHVTYVGRSPHEAFYTMDGREVWVVVRGENYVSVLDGTTYEEKTRITVPNGPGMTIFSPDGKYGYVCSSFTPETEVITVADHMPEAVPAASGALNSAMTRMMVVPEGLGTNNLQPLGIAGQSAELWLTPPGAQKEANAPTSVSLSDQGLVQVLEAAVTGLEPGKPYLLALANEPSGTGVLEPLQGFMTNPAGAAVVNAIGP